MSQHSRKSAAIVVKTEASRDKSVGSEKAQPRSPLPKLDSKKGSDPAPAQSEKPLSEKPMSEQPQMAEPEPPKEEVKQVEIPAEIIPPHQIIHERSLETLAPSGDSG